MASLAKDVGKVRGAFFVIMAVVVALVVLVGFSPSFYLRSTFHPGKHLSLLLQVHGFALSAWIALFLLQTILIVRGSPTLHRRLGWVMTALAASIVLLMGAAIVEQLRRVPPDPPAPIALALGAFDIVAFAVLVSLAIYYRRRPDWHKRLMLSATILLLGAPIVRIVVLFGVHDITKIMILWPIMTDLLFAACFVYDLATRRRVHPAYFVGLGLAMMDQIGQPTVLMWPAWTEMANALQRLVA